MAGATLPGLPGILLGHNGSLAWGATNANIDVRDFAFVELHPEDPDRYRRGPEEAWEEFQTRVEAIHVRFGQDETEIVRSTQQGVTWPRNTSPFSRTDLALEIRDLPADLPNAVPVAVLRLNRAATVADGLAVSEAFTGPPMNMSLADTHGSIGYVAAGRIPVRPESHARFVGLAPGDGNERTYLAYAENPRVVDPAGGRIVTANQRIVGDEYPLPVGPLAASLSGVSHPRDARPARDP